MEGCYCLGGESLAIKTSGSCSSGVLPFVSSLHQNSKVMPFQSQVLFTAIKLPGQETGVERAGSKGGGGYLRVLPELGCCKHAVSENRKPSPSRERRAHLFNAPLCCGGKSASSTSCHTAFETPSPVCRPAVQMNGLRGTAYSCRLLRARVGRLPKEWIRSLWEAVEQVGGRVRK